MSDSYTLTYHYVTDEFTLKRCYYKQGLCWLLNPNEDSLSEIIDTVHKFTDFYSYDDNIPVYAISADVFQRVFDVHIDDWILVVLPENIENVSEMNGVMNKYNVHRFKDIITVPRKKVVN